jgi:hypothetical protein
MHSGFDRMPQVQRTDVRFTSEDRLGATEIASSCCAYLPSAARFLAFRRPAISIFFYFFAKNRNAEPRKIPLFHARFSALPVVRPFLSFLFLPKIEMARAIQRTSGAGVPGFSPAAGLHAVGAARRRKRRFSHGKSEQFRRAGRRARGQVASDPAAVHERHLELVALSRESRSSL